MQYLDPDTSRPFLSLQTYARACELAAAFLYSTTALEGKRHRTLQAIESGEGARLAQTRGRAWGARAGILGGRGGVGVTCSVLAWNVCGIRVFGSRGRHLVGRRNVGAGGLRAA